jgi:CheY-specific phosphatase CheX
MNHENMLSEAYTRSTINVLETLCGYTDIQICTSSTQDNSRVEDIIGIMGINGRIIGSTLIIIPHDSAVNLISKMSGSEPEELSNVEVGHGIAELLNIICGNAKTIVSETEYSFQLTVPRIITCRDYRISDSDDTPAVRLFFRNDEVRFQLYISYNFQDGGNLKKDAEALEAAGEQK